ncbi:MAG TPA: 5-dehydro-4-deoxy-D-glucuronate isomerase [Candidatus Methylacidiphilales bacterium]|nr:5-dehydro-4-deoxy-D-glucuronate isomerase [Candidatus Methylacidiphilales bacterium]
MQTRLATGKNEYQKMTTRELRENFLVDALFAEGSIRLTYWETDRTVLGSAVPVTSSLKLETEKELAADYFCERRELGIINIGHTGKITVDGADYHLGHLDCLYVGRGKRDVTFASQDPKSPAKFYLMSYPAHTAHPTVLAKPADAKQIKLGSQETANQRTIYQYIHEDGIKSCQLVMGYTKLEAGSVWNTMPPHTHMRRSEVYLYFDIPDDAAIFHFMGPGNETRHLCLHSGQAVLSPIWSIHSGCGTRSYTFIWAMGGENQRFADMDGIAICDLL